MGMVYIRNIASLAAGLMIVLTIHLVTRNWWVFDVVPLVRPSSWFSIPIIAGVEFDHWRAFQAIPILLAVPIAVILFRILFIGRYYYLYIFLLGIGAGTIFETSLSYGYSNEFAPSMARRTSDVLTHFGPAIFVAYVSGWGINLIYRSKKKLTRNEMSASGRKRSLVGNYSYFRLN